MTGIVQALALLYGRAYRGVVDVDVDNLLDVRGAVAPDDASFYGAHGNVVLVDMADAARLA